MYTCGTPLSCTHPATQGATELRNVGAAHSQPNAHRAPRAAVAVAGTVHAPRTRDTPRPHTVHCAARVHRSAREARRAQVNPLTRSEARQLVSDLTIFRNRLDDAQERRSKDTVCDTNIISRLRVEEGGQLH